MGGYGYGGYGGGNYGGEPIITLGTSYYIQLITSQYQNSPNYLNWLWAALKKYEDIAQCIIAFQKQFDIDYAVGAQLNIIGQNLGVSRTVPFQPTGGISPILDDNTYRLLLKATQAANTWNGTIDELYPIWQNLFPGGTLILVDNQNMTATIVIGGSFTSIIQQLITNGFIVPRSEGVLYEYTFVELPIFGLDENNSFIAGVDLGHIS
jgi:hypothetical protein